MPSYSALTTTIGQEPADALAAALEEMEPEPYGVGVFEVEDGSGLWEVGAWFTDPPDGIILAILAEAFGAKPFLISEVPEVDWVAHVQRELHPVDAGRFFVFGAHDADKVPEGRIPLLIELIVDLRLDKQRFIVDGDIALRASARAAEPLLIVIDVAKPRPSDIAVHVTSKSFRGEIVRLIGGVDTEIRRFVAAYVAEEIDSPASQQAKIIDVSTQVASAWDAG